MGMDTGSLGWGSRNEFCLLSYTDIFLNFCLQTSLNKRYRFFTFVRFTVSSPLTSLFNAIPVCHMLMGFYFSILDNMCVTPIFNFINTTHFLFSCIINWVEYILRSCKFDKYHFLSNHQRTPIYSPPFLIKLQRVPLKIPYVYKQ